MCTISLYVNQYYNCPKPLDFPAILCHTNSMNKTQTTSLTFSDFTKYDHLSIADACIQAERDARDADRAARAAGATFETIDINGDLFGDDYADAILASL